MPTKYSIINGRVEVAIVEALQNVLAILIMLKLLQESGLSSGNLGELNADLAVVNLEDTDADFDIVLYVVLEVIGAAEGVLDLVLIVPNLKLKILLLEIVDQGLLDHVRVVRGEELGVIIENTFVLLKTLLWLVQLVFDIETGLLCLAQYLLRHVSLKEVSFSHVHSLLLLIFLSLCLLFQDMLDLLLSLGKTIHNHLFVEHILLHPRMRHNLLKRRSVRRLKLPHAVQEILQLGRHKLCSVRFVFRVGFPEDVRAVVGDAFVEWIIWLCARERWMARHHDEQNDGGGEEINLAANIWLSQVDLRCHIIMRAKLCVKIASTIPAFNWSSEPKVRNLKLKIFTQK